MTEFLSENFWLFWTIAASLLLALELTSGDFYLTCLAIGALVAVVADLCCLPFWLQLTVFAITAAVSIFFLRPYLVRHIHRYADPRVSNTDALIGRIGRVSEAIPADGYGRVQIDGDYWKAQGEAGQSYDVGQNVRVTGRDSVIISVAATSRNATTQN